MHAALENLKMNSPGLLVTGTDTGIGKTVITASLAAWLRERLGEGKVGVVKPFATGCRKEREGLVNEDAEALAHFSNCKLPLDMVNPIRYPWPLAPAVAAEQAGKPVDWEGLVHAMHRMSAEHDVCLVEGVGGLLVPLDPDEPQLTVLDFAKQLDYPVLVVARSVLGTLNHTAMTIRLLKENGCRIAGIVLNGYDADFAKADDPSVATNRQWIERMTGEKVLAVIPKVDEQTLQPHLGKIPDEIHAAMDTVDWLKVIR